MARSPKSTIGAYNATIAAIKARTGLSHREAQQAYRSAKVRLGRAPTAADAGRKAIREEAARAGRQLAAKTRAFEKKIERAIERAKLNRRQLKERDKRKIVIKPPKERPRRAPVERGGGGAGRKWRNGEEEPEDYIDIEPPDEISGEEEESPDGR